MMSADEQPKVITASAGPSTAEPEDLDVDVVALDSVGTPFIDALKKSPAYSHVISIIYWNDPIQSALLFGIGNFFFFLITYGEYTVLSLLAYLLLSLLFVAGVYTNGTWLRASFTNEKYENPFSAKLKNPYVLHETELKPHVEALVALLNDLTHLACHALYWTDPVFSAKISVIVWFLAIMGNTFSGVFLLYGLFLASFVWPRIYQEKQAEIDRVYDNVVKHASQYYNLVCSKVPLWKKKKEE